MPGFSDVAHCDTCGSCEACPCECLLLKFTDFGTGCCDDFNTNRITLTQTTGCEWTVSKTYCSPYPIFIKATLTGTTLEVVVSISSTDVTPKIVRWHFIATVSADCNTWYNVSLPFDHLSFQSGGETFFPCDNPHAETGSIVLSKISCECDKCTNFTQEMVLRLRGQAEEVSSTHGICCEEMFADWIIPFTSDCIWEDDFVPFCTTGIDLRIMIQLVVDTATTVKFIITVTVHDGATDKLQIVFEAGGTDPIDCTLEIDLGVFTSYTEFDGAAIDCVEPCSGVGDNVLNPMSAQGGVAGVCT